MSDLTQLQQMLQVLTAECEETLDTHPALRGLLEPLYTVEIVDAVDPEKDGPAFIRFTQTALRVELLRVEIARLTSGPVM